jgi:hypothetical protein
MEHWSYGMLERRIVTQYSPTHHSIFRVYSSTPLLQELQPVERSRVIAHDFLPELR